VGVGAGVLTAVAAGVFSVFCSGTDLLMPSGLLSTLQDASARQTIKNTAYLEFIYRNAPAQSRKCFYGIDGFPGLFFGFLFMEI
jgi:hypothetical protein